jgi:uncharacterized protein (DUF1501 family)
MKVNKLDSLSRRAFLHRTAQLSGVGMASPFLMTLAGMGEAAAAGSQDYKALVCVFLSGGNDHANTVVPVDNLFYGKYQNIRGSIAIPQDQLAATTLNSLNALPSGMRMALAPQLAPLAPLFHAGKLGVQLNIGPLIEPTNLNSYNQKSVRLPPKLMSHNDQQSLWQSNLPEGATAGWGGRMGDLILSGNGGSTFSCISVSGNSLFLSGQNAVSYQISPGGAIAVQGLNSLYSSPECGAMLRRLMTESGSGVMENLLTKVAARSIQSESQFSTAFGSANLTTVFNPENSLASQLKAVARTIACRSSLGVKRQVFFVSLGGFDHHDNLKQNHPGLLAAVGEAMASFYEATVELGVQNSVTTFTASDFGRTLASNGDGSDHGWGSHHFLMGGAVRGGRFYGAAPDITVEDENNIRGGRLIPTTSVDQLIAKLALWFGVETQHLPLLAPNLLNFNNFGDAYF